jgi:hypothetical protein
VENEKNKLTCGAEGVKREASGEIIYTLLRKI